MSWNVRKHIIAPFQCTSMTNRVVSLFDRFTVITSVSAELSENSYLRDLSAQVSKIVFLPYLTVLRLIRTVWAEMWENSYLREISAQVPEIVFLLYHNSCFRFFDRFTAYHNCMSWNVRKLISPRTKCTRITNRVVSLFDRFTTYYNCISWNGRKLISPWILSKISQFCLFDRFTAYHNCMNWNVR